MASVQGFSPGFFHRPAEVVAPELIGCSLIKRLESKQLLWGVIVETEAYSQSEAACHGHRGRSLQNTSLFGPAGHFYVYVSYGVHHCINVVTDRSGWARGVLLRAAALPGEPERVASGPGLLSRRFGINRSHDGKPVLGEHDLWLRQRINTFNDPVLVTTTRIGISHAKSLPWRWYLQASRSVSRRRQGDWTPRKSAAWVPPANMVL